MFNYEHPENISELLTNELNIAIDSLAPPKKVNWRKNYSAYLTEDTRKLKNETNKVLTEAIQTNSDDIWRNLETIKVTSKNICSAEGNPREIIFLKIPR